MTKNITIHREKDSIRVGDSLSEGEMCLSNMVSKNFTPKVFHQSCFPREFRQEPSVHIGRKGPYGNPFVINVHGSREEVIAKYRDWLIQTLAVDEKFKAQFVNDLRGRNLICHCKPLPCHGDVILEVLSAINCTEESEKPHTRAE